MPKSERSCGQVYGIATFRGCSLLKDVSAVATEIGSGKIKKKANKTSEKSLSSILVMHPEILGMLPSVDEHRCLTELIDRAFCCGFFKIAAGLLFEYVFRSFELITELIRIRSSNP